MSMTLASRNGQSAELNVTPLIDVLLVLIIIFMVVLPHHSQGEQAEIPQASSTDTKASSPETNIVVQLLSTGQGGRPRIKINQSEVSWDELAPRLKAVLLSGAQRIAFLKADPEVEFAYVAQVVDLTRAAGADRVGLLSRGGNLRQ